MTINEAPLNIKVTIQLQQHLQGEMSDVESRLMHLGFIQGAKVEVKRKSPFFRGPILVEVRGRIVALSQDEAQLVNVELSL
jgi:Fe2+ transport system protein FeoA